MKVIGKMIYKMVMVLRHGIFFIMCIYFIIKYIYIYIGLMDLDMRDNIKKVKSIIKVHMYGVMALNILDNGQIIRLAVMEYILGLMAENMKVNG
jgi:hypothetical protein